MKKSVNGHGGMKNDIEVSRVGYTRTKDVC